jgi:hypothetical protein
MGSLIARNAPATATRRPMAAIALFPALPDLVGEADIYRDARRLGFGDRREAGGKALFKAATASGF